ncbi:5'(3')-deoxyribonucleotidase [Sporosarcina sp. FSL K6-1522]|uniref:5' nucleotidase, NT5C type n=1 Tax=Sporosarcina sp. FSL K6-1522 TaxID=2921554 RepID=UPI003159EB5F
MKRIAIDMDEVLADFSKKCLEAMNAFVGTSFTKEDLRVKTIDELYESYPDELYQVLHSAEFFRDLEVIPHSQRIVRELNEHFQIVIATAAMDIPTSFDAKYKWLREHFPFLDPQYFIFCGDKNVVQADYLIDDNIKQLNSFTGQGILFTAPRNESIDYEVRADNWKEVHAFFLTEQVKSY